MAQALRNASNGVTDARREAAVSALRIFIQEYREAADELERFVEGRSNGDAAVEASHSAPDQAAVDYFLRELIGPQPATETASRAPASQAPRKERQAIGRA